MSYLQIPAPVDHHLYLAIQYLITLLNAEASSARKQAQHWRDLRLKYDPQQPRVPAGRSNGGEWTDGGGGGTGRVSAPLPRRNPLQRSRRADNWWDNGRNRNTAPDQPPRNLPDGLRDSLKPLYPKPPAGRYFAEQARDNITPENLAIAVSAVAAPETVFLAAVIAGTSPARVMFTSMLQRQRVLRAAAAIEEYLGGTPRAFFNKNGDFIIMSGKKKIRFDINNTGKTDGIANEPHFQFENLTPSGNWRSKGEQHRFSFKKEIAE